MENDICCFMVRDFSVRIRFKILVLYAAWLAGAALFSISTALAEDRPIVLEVKNGTRKDISALKHYMKALGEILEQDWKSPGQTTDGEATVFFVINGTGALTSVELRHSSGNKEFDRAAVETVGRVGQYDPLPKLEQTVLIVNANFIGPLLANFVPGSVQDPHEKPKRPKEAKAAKTHSKDVNELQLPNTTLPPGDRPRGEHVSKFQSQKSDDKSKQPAAQSEQPASPKGKPVTPERLPDIPQQLPDAVQQSGTRHQEPGLPQPGEAPVFDPTKIPDHP
jgi:TonB family protein